MLTRPRSRWLTWVASAAAVLLVSLAGIASASGVHLTRLIGWDEAEEVVRRLGIRSGMRVADVGAGSGWLAVEVARRVGPDGHVFATELGEEQRQEIRESAEAAGLTNMTVVAAAERETGLPAACCDVIYLRNVYHHVADPNPFNSSLYASVAPGGRLAIIDFEPRGIFGLGAGPADRGGHGVSRASVRDELEAAGFRLVEVDARWGRLGYLLVFRR